jgi:penicillin-binding protein 1A
MNSAPPSSDASPAGRRLPGWVRWPLTLLFGSVALALTLVVSAVLVGVIALAVAYPNLPEISGLIDYRPKLPLRIYSADGELIGEFGEERRRMMPISEIPKVMQDAVLAIEDARFFEHSGVDVKGVARAALAHLGEARSQGASTITMQVARNFYLSTERTFTRKIYEVLLAWKIERTLTKPQILELYMNQIFLGQRAYGFGAASEIYFGKPLSKVSVAEAAMLAGLPKAPSAYNPIVNPRRAKVRQRYIVERMLENGFITAAQRDAALAEELKYRTAVANDMHAEYVTESVRQAVVAQYGDAAYTRGLNVYTTLRSADQVAAYVALRNGLLSYDRRQAYRGPEAYLDLPAEPKALDARIAEALEEHPDNDELRAAVVLAASSRKVDAVLQNGEQIAITGNGLRAAASGLADKAPPSLRLRRGSVIRVILGNDGKTWSIAQVPEVEGAFVSLDPRSGHIRAMVGGFDFAKNKFNHVTQAWRQPGSSFKPFIYSAALEKGFTPSTVINDAPLFFDAGSTGSQPWEPKNYDGRFDGPMSLRRGLAKSKNMISIRILESITPGYAQDWVTRFGFEADKHPAYLTMALGAGSVTPLQMAGAYSVFANGGYRIQPTLITRITDSRGQMLVDVPVQPLGDDARVIDGRNAFMMTSLLQEVTRSGTAARARAALKRADIYGKTGTTNDSLDAWFAGWQRSVVAVVWIGHDQPRKLGDRETGGGLALPVWTDYMGTALKGVPASEYAAPEGVVNIGGEWYYEEYTRGAGVHSLGLEDAPQLEPTDPEERKSILDLFRE